MDRLASQEYTALTCPLLGYRRSGVTSHGDVILVMSISYDVISAEPLDICANPLAHIHIKSEAPQPGIVDSYDVLDLYTGKFRDLLEHHSQ